MTTKKIGFSILPAVLLLTAAFDTRAAGKNDNDRLIGAWRLAAIAGADGEPLTSGLPLGMLIYYDVNEAAHTLTHHIIGSNTGGVLVGKDLPRIYQFTAKGSLIVKSALPNEHWSVRWEHY